MFLGNSPLLLPKVSLLETGVAGASGDKPGESGVSSSYSLIFVFDYNEDQIDVVQFREKFAFRITRFATQHSFATHSVQLRMRGCC